MTVSILVIDDEKIVREAVRSILEPEGYSVLEAPNGEIALKLFHEQPVDLVIIDLLMPEQEGLETILHLRRHSPEVKIIAISGGGRFGLSQQLAVAKLFGANRTFSKPFDRQQMLAAIRELLADIAP